MENKILHPIMETFLTLVVCKWISGNILKYQEYTTAIQELKIVLKVKITKG